MALPELKLEVSIVPSETTVLACLKLLDLWQEANPDKRIAMVNKDGKYVYEIRENAKPVG